jgi:hypothetical protein
MDNKRIVGSLISTLVLYGMIISAVAYAGNSFVTGDLRYDLPEIHNAGDYRVNLLAAELPTTGVAGDFSTAWLGVFLHQLEYDQYGNPITDSGKFTQVGVETTRDGVRWFVYSEAGAQCTRGIQWNDRTCYGFYNDLVTLNTWRWYRISRVGSVWGAGIEVSGIYYTLAQVSYNSSRIYLARSETEVGFYEDQDPYITAKFYHNRPQYLYGGNWTDWSESDSTGISQIYIQPIARSAEICPNHYGATPNLYGNERYWFAGSGGQTCSWLLFPSVHIYLPIAIK